MNKIVYLKKIIFFVLTFTVCATFCQTSEIDSLKTLLKEHQINDSIRVDLLNESSLAYQLVDIEKSFSLAKEAQLLADSLNYKYGKASSLTNIGHYYSALSDYEQTINYYQQALEISKQINDKVSIARCLNYIGVAYARQSNYPLTLDYFFKSLKIQEQINDKWGISASLNNIGVIYNYQGNYDLALEYFNKALTIKEELNDKRGIAKCYNNMGISYQKQNNSSLSLEYYQRSLKINREINNQTETANCLHNIGIIYLAQNRIPDAFVNLNESLKIHEEIKNLYGISSLKMNLSDAFLQQNNYSKALSYSLQSLEIAKEKGFLEIQKDNYWVLSKIYSGLNSYKKAYEAHVVYKELNDSIFNKENIEKITQLDFQYKYDKDKQASELEQQKKDAVYRVERKRQAFFRNALLAGFIFVLILSLLIYYNLVQKRTANKLLSEQKSNIEEKNFKLQEQYEEIQQLNEELQVSNEILSNQKEELELHRNNLEKLVKERTIDLEIAKEKAEESDRLKSAFLANISHEIRTPMNAIVGFSNMLNDSELSKEQINEFTSLINENADSLLRLIDDILDVAKIQSGQLEINRTEFNINNHLQRLSNIFSDKKNALEGKDIELKLSLGIYSSEYNINSDPLRIQQIFSNLLENAFKFTEKGYVEFGYKVNSDSNSILFFVKDTGIGLSEKQKESIFKRFTKIETTEKKIYRGTGLGLDICKNLVELLQGKIWVESEAGKGSTFYFTVPLSNKK